MTRIRVTLTALLLSLCVPSSSWGATFRLEAFLSQVRQANPSLKSGVLRAEAAEKRVSPAGTLDDPFFAVGLDEIPVGGGEGKMTRYQVSQTVPFPGKLGARARTAEAESAASHADRATLERQLVVSASQLFYRAFLNQEAQHLNQRIQSLLRQTLESTESRYRVGGASHHEWLLAKVELSVLKTEALRLDREAKTFRAVLNELRDQGPQSELGTLEADFEAKEEAPPTVDLSTQPELLAAQAMEKRGEGEASLAGKSYFPDFVLQGMAMVPSHGGEMQEPTRWGFMVGVNIPLFFFRKQIPLDQAASRDREAASEERRALENRLKAEEVDAAEQLRSARDLVRLYQREVLPSTRMTADNARSGYASRRLPLSQYIDTLRVERTQELEFVASRIDVELAKLRMKELLSQPPVVRLAPSRPTLFGGGSMGGMATEGMGSDTINMGPGMSGPTRKSGPKGRAGKPSSSGGMEGM